MPHRRTRAPATSNEGVIMAKARRKKTAASGKSRLDPAVKRKIKRKVAVKKRKVARVKTAVKRDLRRAKARRRTAFTTGAARLAANKRLVLAFYEQVIGRKDFEAGRKYMGENYRQHSPYATDGHAGLAAFVKFFGENFPNHRYEVKKVIAEGDMVVLHLHGMGGMNTHGEQVVDFFRVKDGKVVEHWDVIQPIPEKSENPNGVF
jgi:predicted SnoaL-like aldol condensation-catalyzing enzyme